MNGLKLLILGILISCATGMMFTNSPNQIEIAQVEVPLPEMVAKEYVPANIEEIVLPSPQDIECLAMNLYREARGSNKDDMVAISRVVVNRVEDVRWEDTVCGVVYERKPGCQFSWTCSPKLRKSPVNMQPADARAYALAKTVAWEVLLGKHDHIAVGATMYHAAYMRPRSWNYAKLTRIGQIGQHIFYKG